MSSTERNALIVVLGIVTHAEKDTHSLPSTRAELRLAMRQLIELLDCNAHVRTVAGTSIQVSESRTGKGE